MLRSRSSGSSTYYQYACVALLPAALSSPITKALLFRCFFLGRRLFFFLGFFFLALFLSFRCFSFLGCAFTFSCSRSFTFSRCSYWSRFIFLWWYNRGYRVVR